MKIFPAIDIKDNRCVRLTQGDFARVRVYENSPYEMAVRWQEEGASSIHVVDLNGADEESFVNRESIKDMVRKIKLPIQTGGGIRSQARVMELLELGVHRVILGTAAVEDKELLRELVREYGEKIIVSIDAKNDKVATRGWKFVSTANALDLCREMEKMGVTTIVYTEISRDGMLSGPDFQAYGEILKETGLKLIASGGISTLSDIKRLHAMGVYGAIIGKAFYEGKLTMREVLACLPKE